jgi:hypothetical protein
VCNSVSYLGCEYQSPAELATLIGEKNLVWADLQSHDVKGCLCSVDLEASLKRAGFGWTRGIDPMQWTVFR